MHRSRFAFRRASNLSIKFRKKTVGIVRHCQIERMIAICAEGLRPLRKTMANPDRNCLSPDTEVNWGLHFILEVFLTDLLFSAARKKKLPIQSK